MALAGPGELPTALDVLENGLGARPTPQQLRKLTIPELEEMSGLLAQLSEAQCEDEIPGGAYLLGGWLAALWSEPIFRGDLATSLLYYPNLLVLDPLADFFDDRSRLPLSRPIRARRPEDGKFNTVTSGPQFLSRVGSFESFRESQEQAVARFAAIVENLYSLESLIRSGVVVLRSQWPILSRRKNALASSVRHDIRSNEMQSLAREPASADDSFAVWDNVRGMALGFPHGVHPSDEPWEMQDVFYYLAKTLAVADASGAQYVPSTERDLELLRRKSGSIADSAHPGEFLAEVARVVVPSFEVSIEQAVKMRQSSESFEDWRSALRQILNARTGKSTEDLREQIQDELRPMLRKVEAELNRSSALSRLKTTAADVIFTGGVQVGAAAMSGGSPAIAAAAAVSSGVLSWIRRGYGQQSLGGAEAVLAALVRGSKKS